MGDGSTISLGTGVTLISQTFRCHVANLEITVVFSSQGHHDDQQKMEAMQRAQAWEECNKNHHNLTILSNYVTSLAIATNTLHLS